MARAGASASRVICLSVRQPGYGQGTSEHNRRQPIAGVGTPEEQDSDDSDLPPSI